MKTAASTLISFILLASTMAYAEFRSDHRRYPAPRDMIRTLQFYFPDVVYDPVNFSKEKVKADCRYLNLSNRYMLGSTNPALGGVPSDRPGPGFVRWWSDCVSDYIRVQWELMTKNHNKSTEKWQTYYSPQAFNFSNKKSVVEQLRDLKWAKLEKNQQLTQVNYLVSRFVGPEAIIKDMGQNDSLNSVVNKLHDSLGVYGDLNTYEMVQKLLLHTLLLEEVITY